jgi:hypothetical protein
MVIKIQEFEEKPKRKYVRKVKVIEEENEEDKIIDLDNIIKKDFDNMIERLTQNYQKSDQNMDDSESDQSARSAMIDIQDLSKNIKKLKISHDKCIQKNTIKTDFTENKNILKISEYEFLSKVDIYLYYLIEPISSNVTKHSYYTSVYNTLSGYIILPKESPFEYKRYISKSEKTIEIVPNVSLHIKEFYINKHDYTYEECNNNLNKKRKYNINNDWSYDFCQLKMKGLNNSVNQKFVFVYENKYITFEHKIETKFQDLKQITNE